MTQHHLSENAVVHFTISAPRSGSTWLAKALGQHPEILSTENRMFGRFFELWKNNQGKTVPRITADEFITGLSRHTFYESLGFETANELATDLFSEFQTFLINYLHAKSGKPVIVDKITPYLGTSQRVVNGVRSRPHSRIIHLIRDGRDVAVSGVFDWIAREDESSKRYQMFVKRNPQAKLKRFFDDEVLEKWARYWREPLVALGPAQPTTLQVQYEKMLADQAGVLQSIFKHLKVTSSPQIAKSCSEAVTFEKLTGRPSGQAEQLAKTRKGISGDWRNYFTKQDAEKFQNSTGPWLQELGYETDDSWINACPDHLDLSLDF
ncbi:MAG: sulfotransferase domain-containing protein [Pirellulaceae bacterium]|nr:sulfotransferase domain-containing protein [Pirellulaceae bacterium]